MVLWEHYWIFVEAGCLAGTFGFVHVRTISDALQENADCKVHEVVEWKELLLSCLQQLFQQQLHRLKLASCSAQAL